jgi:hypothetical protein
MIKLQYLTHKPAAPAPAQRFFDQRVIPVLIDAAGGIETAIEHWSTRVTRSPVPSLVIALATGVLLSAVASSRRTKLARRR